MGPLDVSPINVNYGGKHKRDMKSKLLYIPENQKRVLINHGHAIQ